MQSVGGRDIPVWRGRVDILAAENRNPFHCPYPLSLFSWWRERFLTNQFSACCYVSTYPDLQRHSQLVLWYRLLHEDMSVWVRPSIPFPNPTELIKAEHREKLKVKKEIEWSKEKEHNSSTRKPTGKREHKRTKRKGVLETTHTGGA